MHAAQISTTNALGAFLAVVAAHPLLERLFFASVELAVLSVLVYAAIRVGRIRSARLASILWLLVLAKPLVSLAIGSPIPLVRMHVPEVAVVVPAPEPKPEPVAAPPSVETPKPDDSQPFADDIREAGIEPDMRPPLPAAMPSAQTTPEPTTPEPIVAETPPVLAPEPGPVPSNVPSALLAIWLCGVVVFALRSLIDRIRVRRLVRGARVADADLLARSSSVATQLDLKRPVPVRVTTDLEGPALVGSLFATVLIPDWLAADPNPARLNWALRHELMHWKLRDPLAGLVREFAQMLFYFHPAAWWAGHRWEVAAEQACDRAIVTSAADSADYAEQLYGILVGMQGRLRARIGNGLFATRTQIGQRIAALLNGPLTPRAHLSVLALIGVTVVACITLSIGGAFADKNAERVEDDKSDQAQTVATEQPRAEKIAETANEKLAATPSAATSAPSAPAPILETPVKDAPYVYRGTVVDDTGKPVAGAKITLDHAWSSLPPEGVLPLAVSDTAGHFQLSVPKRGATDAWAKSWSIAAMLLATKDGYGLAGAPAVQFEATGRLAAEQQQRTGDAPKLGTNVLKLTPDDVPIRGRILNTEGRPIAGAPVQAINVWDGSEGAWRAWERRASLGTYQELLGKLRAITDSEATLEARPSLMPQVRTDADGWFTLRGIGRDRLADVLVSGPRLETTVLHVRSGRGAVIKGLGPENVLYPCEFTRVIGPSTAVEGQIVDAASKEPVAGVLVRRRREPPSGSVPGPYLTARTNADGRYRLDGLPIGSNVLEIVPAGNSPFIPQWFVFPTRFSPVPASVNVTLAHGTRVRGRATDARTGRPVQGVVDYLVFRNNPALAGMVNPKRQGSLLNLGIRSDENGFFEIAALPGPGIVAFRADRRYEFPWGEGADQIHGPKWEGTDNFVTVPWAFGPEFYHLLTPVDPAPGAESLTVDLTLRSIVTVTGKVLSPEGKTLRDYSMFDADGTPGQKTSWYSERDETFEIKVYSPTERHRLMFYQRALNLAGYYELTGASAGPLAIKLQPAGTIVGRLVDGHGKPLPEVAIVISSRTGRAENSRAGSEAKTRVIDQTQISADEQGHFAVHGVIPGLSYSAEAIGFIEDSEHRRQPPGAIFKDERADAGQTKNLRDVQITRPGNVGQSKRPADDHSPYVYAGTVVDEAGKPVEGAKIRFDYFRSTGLPGPELGVTDAQGHFRFALRRNQFPNAGTSGPWRYSATFIASKEGYGPDGANSIPFETTGAIVDEIHRRFDRAPRKGQNVLTLVRDDVPIRGRILDIEGRPVSGATVRVVNLFAARDGNLDVWEREAKRSGASYWSLRQYLRFMTFSQRFQDARPPVLPAVTTNADGWFTLHGIGRERVANLIVTGPSIETTSLDVRSRRGEVIKLKKDPRMSVMTPKSGLGPDDVVYPCEFTCLAGPSVPVGGRIVDADSRQPLAGVVVRAEGVPVKLASGTRPQQYLLATTDADGRYRLEGLPLGTSHLGVLPPAGSRHLTVGLEVTTRIGQKPAIIDIPLRAGVLIRGRATDATTGEPVVGSLGYFPFRSNEQARAAAAYLQSPQFRGSTDLYRCDEKGAFEIPILPGKGILTFKADRLDDFPRGAGTERIAGPIRDRLPDTFFDTLPSSCNADSYHLLTPVNPAPGTDSLELDLTLRSGARVKGKVLDPDGEALAEYCVLGKTQMMAWQWNKEEQFVVEGYFPSEHRRLMFYHPARNLVGLYDLKGQPSADLAIKLQPGATFVGRVVDAAGQPLENVAIDDLPGRLVSHPDQAADGQRGVLLNKTFRELTARQTTDKQGRFGLVGILPGLKYSGVTFYTGGPWGRYPVPLFTNAIAGPGEKKDLGTLKFTPPDDNTESKPPGTNEQTAEKPQEKSTLAPPAQTSASSTAAQTLVKPTDDNAPYIYAGTVVDDKGKPVAGVVIYLDYWRASLPPGGPPILAVSDAQGRFQFSRRKSDFSDAGARAPFRIASMVVGTKEGYGPAGGRAAYFETTGKLAQEAAEQTKRQPEKGDNVLRLASDDVPIRGRILDIDGRPVAGALVRAVNIWEAPDGNLDAWEKAARERDTDHWNLFAVLRPITFSQTLIGERPSAAPAVRTDAAGWFTLKGIGRERLADLVVSGPRIETTLLRARSRRGEVIKRNVRSPFARQLDRSDTYYPCEFTVVRGPSVIVKGRVTDDKSKRPVAGVEIWAERIAGNSPSGTFPAQYLSTTTDPDGRYQLAGLPLGTNRLGFLPAYGSRYLQGGLDVATRMSQQPQIGDIALTAGVLVRGRVTDERTGLPLRGNLRYFAFRSNPNLEAAASFQRVSEVSQQARFGSDETGVFEIPVLPGPGILAFRASDYHAFPFGVGADRIDGPKNGTPGDSFFLTAPTYCLPQQYHLVTSINPRPREESITLNLSLRSGLTVKGKVYGPERKALSDYYIFIDGHAPMWSLNAGQMFEVKGYEPKDRRLLMFYYPPSNLVGHYELTGPPPNHLEIALLAGATIRGRVVDSAGRPLEDLSIEDAPKPENSRMDHSPAALRGVLLNKYLKVPGQRAVTDQQGRFELVGIVPGAKYSAVIHYTGGSFGRYPAPIFTDVMVSAGEKKDLGDLRFKPPDANAAAEPPKPKEPTAEVIEVHGRVLLPDGKPAAGARVLAVRRFWTARIGRHPVVEAVAGSKGEFIIRFPKHQPHEGAGAAIRIVAKADGFAPQWSAWTGTRDAAKELVLTLVASSPIHGRILDLEGKPVRGVRIKPVWQDAPKKGLEAWLKGIRSGDNKREMVLDNGSELPAHDDPALPPVVTDENGRFTLDGIGRDRVARLELRGESIAYAEIDVVTRPIQPITRKDDARQASIQLFGSDFTYQAAPTRPIVGTVRDATTGAPLVGVSIQSRHLAGVPTAQEGVLETKTDAQGRYRLIGMGKGHGSNPNEQSAIAVYSNDDQPYLVLNHVAIPESVGLDPITLDFRLTRGLWITGRVTDKSTGAPVTASLLYSPSRSNPFVANLPEINRTGGSIFDHTHDMTRADGSFRVVGFPGPGLVSAHAYGQTYTRDFGASEIPAMTKDRQYPTFSGFEPINANAMKEINPPAGTNSVTCDLALDPGQNIHITLIDRAGQPVNPCMWSFSFPGGSVLGGSRDSTIDIKGLAPRESRPLMIVQPKRRLGKVLTIHNEENSVHSLTITLDPCATVKGRLVDGSGVPSEHVWLKAVPQGYAGAPFMPQILQAQTDADGRFVLDQLPADCGSYSLAATPEGSTVVNKVAVVAGQTVDLGDIKLTGHETTASVSNPPAAPAVAKSVSNEKSATNVIHGRVLLPDGKPAAGAKVVAMRRYWVQGVKRTPLAKMIAGSDGAFAIAIPQNLPYDDIGTGSTFAWIGAEVDGFGTGYALWDRRDKPVKELDIKMLPEVPIHGRIVDLEGKPVAGAHVAVDWQASPREEFGRWLKSVRAGSRTEFNRLEPYGELQGYDDDSKPPIVTDRDGRFTLRGIGADRVARLAVHGNLMADATIDVIARPMQPFLRHTWGENTSQVFGVDFTYQAAPTRPIVGTVRDAATGTPLAGVRVQEPNGPVHTQTDSQGKYRLVGLPKSSKLRWKSSNEISFFPGPDQPYLPLRGLEIADSPGLGPIEANVKLARGVWINGRVTEKETGAAAVSAVMYFPALSNPAVKELPYLNEVKLNSARQPSTWTGPDGTFRVVGLPGRGLVGVRGIQNIYVAGVDASRFAELAKNYPKNFYWGNLNLSAVREIEPAAGAASVTCDLVVSAGGTIRVILADRAGKPVSPCVFNYDMARGGMMNSRTDESPFDLRGFEPKESRPIVFQCAKQRIGKALLINYDQKSPHSMTVTLDPWATLKGRLVDTEGVPIKGVHLQFYANIGKKGFLPSGNADCDADGRFVCDHIASGADSYSIVSDGIEERTNIVGPAAGKTIDLGDIKVKREK